VMQCLLMTQSGHQKSFRLGPSDVGMAGHIRTGRLGLKSLGQADSGIDAI
jgi:hypothetical protein